MASADPLAAFKESLVPLPAGTPSLRQTSYVPVYSSLIGVGGQSRLDFSVTVSIRNASETTPLILERIDYFDTAGHLVQHYLASPVALRPFGTVEIFIPTNDVRGGTGANFVIGWAALQDIAEPVIESIMVGGIGTRGYSFVVPGRTIRPAPSN